MKKVLIFCIVIFNIFTLHADEKSIKNFIEESNIEIKKDSTVLNIMDKFILNQSINDITEKENVEFDNDTYKLIQISINKKNAPYKYRITASYFVSVRFTRLEKVDIHFYYELVSNEPELEYELMDTEVEEKKL